MSLLEEDGFVERERRMEEKKMREIMETEQK